MCALCMVSVNCIASIRLLVHSFVSHHSCPLRGVRSPWGGHPKAANGEKGVGGSKGAGRGGKASGAVGEALGPAEAPRARRRGLAAVPRPRRRGLAAVPRPSRKAASKVASRSRRLGATWAVTTRCWSSHGRAQLWHTQRSVRRALSVRSKTTAGRRGRRCHCATDKPLTGLSEGH